jgi:hypothetical protein
MSYIAPLGPNSNPEGQQIGDFITVLSNADGQLLTKQHTTTATIPYDKGYLFTSKQVPINSLEDLAGALECPPQSCVILGKIRDGVDPCEPHLRLLYPARDGTPPSYEPTTHTYVIVDVDEKDTPVGWLDNMPGTMRRVLGWLPPELREVDVKWRGSSVVDGLMKARRLRRANCPESRRSQPATRENAPR